MSLRGSMNVEFRYPKQARNRKRKCSKHLSSKHRSCSSSVRARVPDHAVGSPVQASPFGGRRFATPSSIPHRTAFRRAQPPRTVSRPQRPSLSSIPRLQLLPPVAADYHRRRDRVPRIAMDYLTRILYVLLCLTVPLAWGLVVEWVFHKRRRRRAPRPPAVPRSDAQ